MSLLYSDYNHLIFLTVWELSSHQDAECPDVSPKLKTPGGVFKGDCPITDPAPELRGEDPDGNPPFVPDDCSSLFLFCFLSLARRFWNQILTWRSESPRFPASSALRRIVMYLLKWNSFSSSSLWWSVYTTLYLSFVLVLPTNRKSRKYILDPSTPRSKI